MEIIKNYFLELASLFGYTYDNSFFDYLKSISTPNTTTCGKEIKEGEGGWKCETCELDSYSIYCNECFIKEKHLGHKISFSPGSFGFCDCGVNTVLKPEGFCNKHKGDYTNIKELMNFIKSSIDEKLFDNINNIFNKIFLLLIDKIKKIIIKEEVEEEEDDDDDDEEDKNENEIFKIFDYLETFGDKLYKNNLSLFYLFTLKFTENFPYETNHKCFNYDENKNLVTFIKKDKEKKHICICPFMQVMIYVLKRRKTKQNSYSFFNLFFRTFKNKIVSSLCYLNCISQLFYNKNLQIFREMGFQLVDENLSIVVCQKQNLSFLEECFEEIYLVCNYFLKEKEYDKLNSLFSRFNQLITNLPSSTIIGNINSNTKLLNIIIKTCCLINNENVFDNKIKFQIIQSNRYIVNLSNIELYSLFSLISLMLIINFDDQKVLDFLFKMIFEKINKFQKFKENLPGKIFSPYLIIIKCYSIFLNRFCFHYSIKNGYDLLDSFNHFLDIFPQARELNIFVFKELISYFGFIISQLYSFFIYYGKEMTNYYLNYFNIKLFYNTIDINLMKYLLCQPEIKEQFKIQNILILSDIASSNKLFQNIINEVLNLDDIEPIQKEDEKNLRYINSLLEYLYLIIRDNFSMEKIAFRNVDFKMKMKDEIYEKLYEKEKNKIHNLVKNDIIQLFLGNKNSVKRDDCIDHLDQTFNGKFKDLLDEMIKNNCEKKVLTNSLIEYSLKKEMANLFDLDYIKDYKHRKNAYEYITNSKSNINIIEPLDIEKKLMKNVYQSFYNEKNINELIKLYNLIYIHKEKDIKFKNIFYSNLTKILSFAFKLCSTDLLDEEFKIKLLGKMNEIQDFQFKIDNISDENEKQKLLEQMKNKPEQKIETKEEKNNFH